MNTTDTPRTDAATKCCNTHPDYVHAEFARELERENIVFRDAQKARDDCDAPTLGETKRLRAENAELLADKELLDWLEAGPSRHVIGETGCQGVPFFICQDRDRVETVACGASTVRSAIRKARAALGITSAL